MAERSVEHGLVNEPVAQEAIEPHDLSMRNVPVIWLAWRPVTVHVVNLVGVSLISAFLPSSSRGSWLFWTTAGVLVPLVVWGVVEGPRAVRKAIDRSRAFSGKQAFVWKFRLPMDDRVWVIEGLGRGEGPRWVRVAPPRFRAKLLTLRTPRTQTDVAFDDRRIATGRSSSESQKPAQAIAEHGETIRVLFRSTDGVATRDGVAEVMVEFLGDHAPSDGLFAFACREDQLPKPLQQRDRRMKSFRLALRNWG